MRNYTVIPPKQKYMSLAEIDKLFGSRGVVAYNCRVMDGTPQGGYVIAVQNNPGTDSAEIKAYMHQFKAKFPDKEPIYYIRLEPGATDKHWAITYDNAGKTGNIKPPVKTAVKTDASARTSAAISTNAPAKTSAAVKTNKPEKNEAVDKIKKSFEYSENLPDLTVKNSAAESAIENIPFELIAEAIRTSLTLDKLDE